MRLLTYNIAHGRGLSLYQGFTSHRRLLANLERLSRFLVQERLDVIALQEIDESSTWAHGVNMLEVLKSATGLPHGLMGINTRRQGRWELAYGNAFLARFPLVNGRNQPFGNARLGEKGFLYAEVRLPDQSLVPLINLHLDFRSRKRRILQIEQLIAYLQTEAGKRDPERRSAPIVCGDFNATAKQATDAVQHLFHFLKTIEHYHLLPEAAATFPSQWPRRCIDFVLVPGTFQIQRCEVLPARLSDHRPVLLEFDPA